MIMNLMGIMEKIKRFTASGIILTVFLMSVFLCGCEKGTNHDELWLTDVMESTTEQTDYGSEAVLEADAQNGEAGRIYVYICGAVVNPGVYDVQSDSRLFEVVELAGGFTSEADKKGLNLARHVTDGEQIIVLTKEEAEQKAMEASENKELNAESGLVNINTASLSELTRISGIGESRAQAIIAYREKNGAFRSVEEIKKVDGIKDGLFAKIKDYITV